MLFNSSEFFVFFVVVFCVYWVLPHSWQNRLLLLASMFFYGWWDYRFLSLFLGNIFVNYVSALALHRATAPERKKQIIIICALLNLGALFFFKYFNFFADTIHQIASVAGLNLQLPELEIILPLGISFFTFQAFCYVIDVYRGHLEPTRNFFKLALFVSFFPQLVAGPIERATNLLPQIDSKRTIDVDRLLQGLVIMAFGFFKKMAIADNLAVSVNYYFDNLSTLPTLQIAFAFLLFTFQIYCDFSGYTDIARGAAQTLGFRLTNNFRAPFFARNPIDFWDRWHISLSKWFQDYLYFPLGMHYLRKGNTFLNRYKAHFYSMCLIGLWHGADIKFLAFGAFWGLCIIGYSLIRDKFPDLPAWLAIPVHFAFVCFGFGIFRINKLAEMKYLFLNHSMTNADILFNTQLSTALLLALVVVLVDAISFLIPKAMEKASQSKYMWIKFAYVVASFGIILLLRAPQTAEFIYFQF